MRSGKDRSCDRCSKILKAKYFPYKTVSLCLWCYEKEHDITLHTLRARLRVPTFSTGPRVVEKKNNCPYCGYKSVIKEGGINICQNCNSEVSYSKTHLPNKQKKDVVNNFDGKKCPFCRSAHIKNKGKRGDKQRYICLECSKNWSVDIANVEKPIAKPRIVKEVCPRCGSAMIKRSGKFGKFYGCTKYPLCKGTRNY